MAEENKEKLKEKKTEEVNKVTKFEKSAEKTEANKESAGTTKTEAGKEGKPDENKTEDKKAEKPKKVPKSEAVVNSHNAHLSTKTSSAIGKFIIGKTIDQAISDLQEVAAGRKAIPMKGEIPHRKGKIMSGRFPKNASEHFIKLLKALAGNVNVNGLEEPVIAESIANIGSRPYGQFGRIRKKRTHIKIIAKNKNDWKKSRSKKAKMNKVKKPKNKKSNSGKKEKK